ncbi:MAG: NAD-dependent epimerase/dehydratase family protein [Rhodospirillales bacterium]
MSGSGDATAVTGANGFVGAALCRALLARGEQVVGIVRDPGAGLPKGVERRIVPAIGPDTDWSAALAGVGRVVHLAARVHVPWDGAADALAEFRQVNTYGTESLAREAAAQRIARFVFISTIKVLGDGKADGTPYMDDDAPAPTDAYGRSKAEAEQVLDAIAASSGMAATVLRPPLLYGPGIRANFLTLLRACDSPYPLPLGGIDNRRSLLGLDNLVSAILLCLDYPAAAGRKFLVRDGEDLSTPGLAARLRKALGRPERIVAAPVGLLNALGRFAIFRPAVQRVAGSLTADDAGIRTLGWLPPLTVDQGLAQVAAWWRAR